MATVDNQPPSKRRKLAGLTDEERKARRKAQLAAAKRRSRAKAKAAKADKPQQPKAKDKGFVARGKKFFLTYSQCEGQKEDLLEFLQKTIRAGVDKYIVCRELHKDGNPHLHCYFSTRKQYQIRNARILDWNNTHPNIEVARSDSRCIHYCKKDEDYITNCTFDTWERARDLAIAGNWKGACHLIMQEQPKEAALYMDKFEKNFKKMAEIHNRLNNPVKKDYAPEDFKDVECNYDPTKLALVVSGPSGIGKTQWLITKHKNPLVVRHMDKLKRFDPTEHDIIIFDDMNFSHWPRESCIHLLDMEVDTDINVKCSMVTIPKRTPRAFTTNLDPTDIFSAKDKAIWRRYKALRLSEDIRKMPSSVEDDLEAPAMLKEPQALHQTFPVWHQKEKIKLPTLEDILDGEG